MDDDHVMDPQENPVPTDHLPVVGEVGNGSVPYHDPVTQPTDDAAVPPQAVPLEESSISSEDSTQHHQPATDQDHS